MSEGYTHKMENKKLSKTMEISGPPIRSEYHASKFKKKHKKSFVKGKKWFAIKKRKFTDAPTLVTELLKVSNVKDRVKNIKLI